VTAPMVSEIQVQTGGIEQTFPCMMRLANSRSMYLRKMLLRDLPGIKDMRYLT
jgi:hypothetical protein